MWIKKYLKKAKNPEQYDFKKYWTKDGEQYFTNYSNLDDELKLRYDTQADLIIKILSDLDFKSICEVGCGFGRVTQRILSRFNIAKDDYFAFDISPHQIENAKRILQDKVNFRVSAIEDITEDLKYDLVLASEVLMHIPHDKIMDNLIKLIKLSRKYVVNIDWKETDSSKSSYCNFAHDYKKLYESQGLKVKTFDLDQLVPNLTHKINQTLYLAIKN